MLPKKQSIKQRKQQMNLDKIAKQKPVIDENSKNLEEIVIPPEKREEILNELRQVLKKWNTINNLSY